MTSEPDLNQCNVPDFIKNLNVDTPPNNCEEIETDLSGQQVKTNQKDVTSRDLSWLEEATQSKKGIGQSALCDPLQTGHITNEQGFSPPNRQTIYKYSKSIRGTDEAVQDMFRDLVVLDEDGKAHNVPIMWGTQERAVAHLLQSNVRKDEGLVVDRPRLPFMSIVSKDMSYNLDRYIYHKALDYSRSYSLGWSPGFTTKEKYSRDTVFGVAAGIPIDISYELTAWTYYGEDMNQIVEQVLTKFSQLAYIRVRGIAWEIGVKLDSIGNNIETDPGDQANRVVKYTFGLTAESYVSQPIVRKKAVLKTQVDVVDKLEVDKEDITEVITRLEEAVKELEE